MLVDTTMERAEAELSNVVSTAWKARSGEELACKNELENLQDLGYIKTET